MKTAEILIPRMCNATGRMVLKNLYEKAEMAGIKAKTTQNYKGDCDWLVIWGVGGENRSDLRHQHIARGGRVLLWDIGYFRRTKIDGHCRPSIDDDYATRWIGYAPPDPSRWNMLNLKLRDDCYDPEGHIILAGIGPKQRAYMFPKLQRWEEKKLDELKQRFPGRRIVYRPKPKRPFPPLKCETDATSRIEDVLNGASLVVCMHSNVAIDAVLAGIPYEAEDGVSKWLEGKPYTMETRQDFVYRLAWWQWKAEEMDQAWKFLGNVINQADHKEGRAA